MMTQYSHTYLNAQSDMLNTKFNLSTSYKIYMILLAWGFFSVVFIPLMYYIYIYILNKSDLYLCIFLTLLWTCWDIYPLCMTDNGYKLKNIFVNLFDTIYNGSIWVLVSLYFYNNYCKIIEKYNIITFILFLLNIFIILLFFYAGYIYNRRYTEHNWLVKLGDKLNWEKYLKYISFNF
jgi:hypothetical protein